MKSEIENKGFENKFSLLGYCGGSNPKWSTIAQGLIGQANTCTTLEFFTNLSIQTKTG